jgi:hypothetical protein
MIRTMGQCVVAPKDVGVEAMVGGSVVAAVEGLVEVDAAELEEAVADVVADVVAIDHHHS